ncbi:MAG TPA: Sua5/YciO/YrdC/YwlC family protein [Pseudomonadales bacterium]
MSATITVEQAAAAIHQGQVIAYPTEAVWGLGCDPFRREAVERLLALKQRPQAKGLILVAASLEQLQPLLAELTPEQWQQLASTTAIPTTWLVPFNATTVPDWIVGEHALLAVRISSHPLVRRLCELAGMPLVSSSANPQALPAARSLAEVQAYFADVVPCCDGELGGASRPSTIRNLLTGQILRE